MVVVEEVVRLEVLQPKKVGRVFRPRLMKVLVSGMLGKEVPFAIVLEVENRS